MRPRSGLLSAVLLIGACGGSASETPPPLRPLSPSAAVPAAGAAPAGSALVPEDETEDEARPPAATWGGAAPR